MRESDQYTLRGMLHRTTKWYPDNEAVVDETTRLTYAELKDSAQRCAAIYFKLGVRKGDRVVFMLYPSTIHCVALFAAFELGAIPVGLHYRETAKALAPMVERLSPRVLVYDAGMEDKAKIVLDLCPMVTGSIRAASSVPAKLAAGANPDAEIPADLKDHPMEFEPMPIYETDPALIVLSSGTTGVPKGIVHTNRSYTDGARGAVFNYNGLKSGDSYLNLLTTSFVAWYNSSMAFFNVGAKIVFRSKWDPEECLRTIQEEKISIAFLVPTMYRMIFAKWDEIGKYDLSSIRMAAFAGEIMDLNTLKKVKKYICPHLMQLYGTTELGASAGTIMFEEDMVDDLMTSVGKPMPNTDIRIIEPGGTRFDELEQGKSGEIIVSGPTVSNIVWDGPGIARKIFEPDGKSTWWHSGDMGHLDARGWLYLEGRTDDMIISGGINIMPARVEEVLLGHPDVTETAVVGIADQSWGQKVMAFVVSKNPDLKIEDLEIFMKDSELADYQRPRAYKFVEMLPRTATGKMNRKALRDK